MPAAPAERNAALPLAVACFSMFNMDHRLPRALAAALCSLGSRGSAHLLSAELSRLEKRGAYRPYAYALWSAVACDHATMRPCARSQEARLVRNAAYSLASVFGLPWDRTVRRQLELDSKRCQVAAGVGGGRLSTSYEEMPD